MHVLEKPKEQLASYVAFNESWSSHRTSPHV